MAIDLTYNPTNWVDGHTIVNAEHLDNMENGILTNRAYCSWIATWAKQRASESFSTPWLCIPYISLWSPRDHRTDGQHENAYNHGKYGEIVEIHDFYKNPDRREGQGQAGYRFVFRVNFDVDQIRDSTDYSITLETHYHPSDGISSVNDESPHLDFIIASQSRSSGNPEDAFPDRAPDCYYGKRVDGFDYYLVSGTNQIRGPWYKYMRYRFVINGGMS